MLLDDPTALDLYDEEFEGLELDEAELPSKTLTDCVFRGCRLQAAVLDHWTLLDCTFEECDLSLVRLDGLRAQGVRFRHCKLRGVDWVAAASLRLLELEDCMLDDASFLELDLTGIVLRRCRLRNALFSGAVLQGADLRGSDLRGARFDGADLRKADLREAQSYAFDPRTTRAGGARLNLPEAAVLLAEMGLRVEP